MGKIILPGDHEGMTEKQRSAAVNEGDLPPCEGTPGVGCPHPVQPVMIAGYDDKMRCPACNKVHIALVEQEAGESNPLAEAPQFVSAKLDAKARMGENLRRKRIGKLFDKFEQEGHRGRPSESINLQPVAEGDFKDMKDAMAKDEHGTRDEGISEAEKRQRILAKYGQRKGGSKMR